MEVFIKNQNKDNGRLCDTKKNSSIIKETKINKVKVSFLLTNSI